VRIIQARCTCPLGKHGFCPHVAAVLLTYVRQPEMFRRSWWEQLKLSWFGRAKSLQQAS
jgi:uncharacterized Zn finger protein